MWTMYNSSTSSCMESRILSSSPLRMFTKSRCSIRFWYDFDTILIRFWYDSDIILHQTLWSIYRNHVIQLIQFMNSVLQNRPVTLAALTYFFLNVNFKPLVMRSYTAKWHRSVTLQSDTPVWHWCDTDDCTFDSVDKITNDCGNFYPGSISGQGKIMNVPFFYHEVNMVLWALFRNI